jgi:carbamoyl-phosphate synthase large subunit
MEERINILLTCAGRRVGLIRAFRDAAESLNIRSKIVGTDVSSLSPALYGCDVGLITKSILHDEYIPELLSIVKKQEIKLVVPTIDPELMVLARHRPEFEKLGARVLVSSLDVVETCQDKRKAYRFLIDHGFDTPVTRELSEVAEKDLTFPVFLKPWDGSASRSNATAATPEEFHYLSKRIPHCIVQEHISGQEFTCDVYVDFQMEVRAVVPRKRIETRAGEVSKSQTVKLPQLMEACRKLVTSLKAGPGVVTLQCFITKDNRIKFIEINPRFGGGVPLSIRAGADFPRWILSEMTGKPLRVKFDGWQDLLFMLRYDEAMWVENSKIVR